VASFEVQLGATGLDLAPILGPHAWRCSGLSPVASKADDMLGMCVNRFGGQARTDSINPQVMSTGATANGRSEFAGEPRGNW